MSTIADRVRQGGFNLNCLADIADYIEALEEYIEANSNYHPSLPSTWDAKIAAAEKADEARAKVDANLH